jgi:hypothetical protein
MAVEPKRGCGFRQVGGIYLVAPALGRKCDRLPFPLIKCECCGQGYSFARGWSWVTPAKLFGGWHQIIGEAPGGEEVRKPCPDQNWQCFVCMPVEEKHGLIWIGRKFYSPDSFTKEASQLGVSRRIKAIPRNFKLGHTWVFCAHVDGDIVEDPESDDWLKPVPAIFCAFKPAAIEKIITETQSKDPDFMADLKRQGMTPVVVPDDDPDHNPKGGENEE